MKTFWERLKEHFRSPSTSMTMIIPQVIISVWTISPLWVGNHTTLLGLIKGAMLIRVKDPSLNKNIGKYQLSHIWDEVLFKTQDSQLK